jgi:hypothetical protein
MLKFTRKRLVQILSAKFNRNPLSIYGDEKYGYYLRLCVNFINFMQVI